MVARSNREGKSGTKMSYEYFITVPLLLSAEKMLVETIRVAEREEPNLPHFIAYASLRVIESLKKLLLLEKVEVVMDGIVVSVTDKFRYHYIWTTSLRDLYIREKFITA